MDSEETRKEIERLGELLKQPIADYKKALSKSNDFDEASSRLLPAKETLEKIVKLAQMHKQQLDRENESQ